MSEKDITKEQQEELQKLADDMVEDAKDVVKDYKNNPSELDENTHFQVHESSPYVATREERLVGKIPTTADNQKKIFDSEALTGSIDLTSVKIHEL